MAHEVENMVYLMGDETPWHGLGEKVNEIMDLPDCLNWDTEAREMFLGNGDLVTSFRALVRSSDNSVLGVAGDDYKPHNNKDLWSVFKHFAENGDMHITVAGSLRKGAIVWALADMGRSFMVGNNDKQTLHALMSSSHDGKQATLFAPTAIRVVCANTQRMAIQDIESNNRKAHRQTHKAVFNPASAKDFVRSAYLGFDTYESQCNRLKNAKLEREAGEIFLAELLAPKVLEMAIEKSIGLKWQDEPRQSWLSQVMEQDASKSLVYELLHSDANLPMRKAGGDMAKEKDNTFFGAVQGITRYVDHTAGRNSDNRLSSSWFGKGDDIKTQALSNALDYARILQ